MADSILVLNAGSSSLKFQLFAPVDGRPVRRLKGQLDGIAARPRFRADGPDGERTVEREFAADAIADLPAALAVLGDWLSDRLQGSWPAAVGHRVVHGGTRFERPVVVDDDVLAALRRLEPLAPLHQPNNLAPIETIRQLQPGTLQVACFDTAFHRRHGELADRFALPETLYRNGIRRYGFHGLSYEYIAQQLPVVAPEVADGRVVVAHLGNGASLCALHAGRSLDSTMGFTALDGLPMGTRPGSLDPGVVLHLIANEGMAPAEVERLLYHECGLKALSGGSSDVRDLLARDDAAARLALDFFAYRIAKETAALATVLGGLDAVVFTAGIGENAPAVRAAVCDRLAWLGLVLDADANSANALRVSTTDATVAAYVVPTDEELMIATHTLDLIGGKAATAAVAE